MLQTSVATHASFQTFCLQTVRWCSLSRGIWDRRLLKPRQALCSWGNQSPLRFLASSNYRATLRANGQAKKFLDAKRNEMFKLLADSIVDCRQTEARLKKYVADILCCSAFAQGPYIPLQLVSHSIQCFVTRLNNPKFVLNVAF